jgi:hypothetical protein
VNGKIVGDVENGRVITGIVRSATDANLNVYAGGTGSVILAGQSDVSIGHTSGQVDIYGDVEFNSGTTAFQSGNSVDFNCPVDFSSATAVGLPYATVANTTAGSVTLVVGNVMTAGYLNVRLIDKGVTLGVEFNYDPADFTSVIDAYSDDPSVGNVFDGTSTVAVGNTTWTEVTTLSTVGDRITFTLTDHSSHKVYRATVTMRNVPDAGILGAAYAIIELLL